MPTHFPCARLSLLGFSRYLRLVWVRRPNEGINRLTIDAELTKAEAGGVEPWPLRGPNPVANGLGGEVQFFRHFFHRQPGSLCGNHATPNPNKQNQQQRTQNSTKKYYCKKRNSILYNLVPFVAVKCFRVAV